MVGEYFHNEGIEVSDYIVLEIRDNLDVAAHDPKNLPEIVKGLNL